MKTGQQASGDTAILSFRTTRAWSSWLEKNHASSSGIWLKIARKGSAVKSISYDEALEGALCYGWIDGQKKGYNDEAWLQRFTPRGPRSIWSKVNREKAQALIDAGRMRPAGLQAVERARANGQWDAAYDSQKNIEVPEDLRKELDRRPAAMKFFQSLNSINRYAILHRIQTAKKPDTRLKRIKQYVEMLEKGEKIYP
jgi:uncharacterized protein YdeI (YjbR/CyaY-like superfamily)